MSRKRLAPLKCSFSPAKHVKIFWNPLELRYWTAATHPSVAKVLRFRDRGYKRLNKIKLVETSRTRLCPALPLVYSTPMEVDVESAADSSMDID